MKIKKIGETSDITRHYQVDGAEPIPHPDRGGEVLPMQVEVSFLNRRWLGTVVRGDWRSPAGQVSPSGAKILFDLNSRRSRPEWLRQLERF